MSAPRPPPEVNYFYNDLSPYGTWVYLEGSGWCWQPTVVVINRAWRPYCDSGHWIYSDAGWYWGSDYSWGWAPFHYGRWYQHERCGWVWFPDRVWAPAWVTWRYGGSSCGWAPLPPRADFIAGVGFRFNGVNVGLNFDFGLRPEHYTFVGIHDFTHHDLGHRRLAVNEVRNVYNRTTIINNYTVQNNTVINHGIPVDRVATATHTQIRKVPIRDVPSSSAAVAVRSSERSGSVAYRTRLTAPARTASTMVAQKVDERHPVIHHQTALPTASSERRYQPGTSSRPAASRNTQVEAPRTPQPTTGTRESSRPQTRTAPVAPTPQNSSSPSRWSTGPNNHAQPQIYSTPSATAPPATSHSEDKPATRWLPPGYRLKLECRDIQFKPALEPVLVTPVRRNPNPSGSRVLTVYYPKTTTKARKRIPKAIPSHVNLQGQKLLRDRSLRRGFLTS